MGTQLVCFACPLASLISYCTFFFAEYGEQHTRVDRLVTLDADYGSSKRKFVDDFTCFVDWVTGEEMSGVSECDP